MINQLNRPYNYSLEESTCVNNSGNNWGSQTNCIKALKVAMNTHFDNHQNEKCCYCGLLYDRTGRGEVEHIAPKEVAKYPQFSYTPNNLAKACQLCNSSSMKHTYDSVSQLHQVYEQCEFKIVHPYLDNHLYHYKFNYGVRQVLIAVNNDSDKARESIRLFELDSEKRTRARAIERNQERLENLYNLPINIRNRIKRAVKFR
ncbi:hypothetical protein Q2T41_00485 [Maribacter confluentis]|uniref:HNH endonuclease n=1 Tax=Maribacter confluentis TaxID=1656093 RepID=A0ABT8RKZ5_9FLAO|nr:hypothetical protein [Maribacter confluentis]MDO1511137.1 hypothetical protein [Maribacter confluentis]